MREIKFRAWDKQENKWITDHIGLNIEDGKILIYDRRAGGEHDQVYHYPDAPFFAKGCFDGIVLMQYTGLKDKNDKESYHKDIILYDGDLWIMEWNYNSACFELMSFDGNEVTGMDYSMQFEVIGNIYENPEFLRKD